MAAAEIKEMLKTAKTQRQQFAALHGDQLLADGSIPITFTKVSKEIKVSFNCGSLLYIPAHYDLIRLIFVNSIGQPSTHWAENRNESHNPWIRWSWKNKYIIQTETK